MDFQAIHDRLRAIDAPGLKGADEPREPNKAEKDPGRAGQPFLLIEAARMVDFLTVCRDDPKLDFKLMIDITATDPKADAEDLAVLVELLSITKKHRLSIKAFVPKSAPSLPSATAVYRAAQWNERECAEMYGITFVGHPDPRHILLPDDWDGYPLRKDYVFPTEYNGISCE
ncbi:MAG: NADH-quinone oxidoreductase subunit C [Chlamydiales bacterium]|jgi:NADH-quinone oxidoreductase subunit C